MSMVRKRKERNRKIVRKIKRSFSDTPMWMCITLIFLGIFFIVIYTYSCLYLQWPIERQDAIHATGTFDSYEYLLSPKSGAVSEVCISFSDREELYLNAYSTEMDAAFESLKRGDRLDMLLHPNSEYIWEISSKDNVILSFDDAKSIMKTSNWGFGVIFFGVGLLSVSMGIVVLFVKYVEYKKRKSY